MGDMAMSLAGFGVAFIVIGTVIVHSMPPEWEEDMYLAARMRGAKAMRTIGLSATALGLAVGAAEALLRLLT